MNMKFIRTWAMLVLTLVIGLSVTGGTIAWFTDSVSSADNTIKSGTLNLEVEILKEQNAEWETLSDEENEKVFDYELWEPGYIATRGVTVQNAGTLALKYQMYITPNGEGDLSKLANVIDVYRADAWPTSRTALGTRLGTLADVVTGDVTLTGKLAADQEDDVFYVSLKMQESAGNEYQNLSIGDTFDLKVVATQDTVESDSFDNQYDANAELPSLVYVSSQQEFEDAFKNNKNTIHLNAGNYTMPEPDLRGKTVTISGDKNAVLDMSKVDARDQFVTGATMVFDGVTLNFGKVNYMGLANTASLTYKDCDINGLQFLFGDNVVFENCNLNANGAEHCVWTYGAKNVSFTDCDFTYGDRGINCYSDNDVPGGKQTVNFTNCSFTTENTASKGAVEINSCFFSVGIEANLNGCTAPAYGELAYVSQWDSTNGAKTKINIQ